MERHNCPNCGAPISSTQCPYCGTVFYDFTVMDFDKPTYIRIRHNGQYMVFRALARSMDVCMSPDEYVYYCDNRVYAQMPSRAMDVTIDFSVLPDDEGVLMKRKDITNEIREG